MLSIGIDIGGMSIKGAAVDENGKIHEIFSTPTYKGESAEETLDRLIEGLKQYIYYNHIEDQIVGIGVGVPGCIDTEAGVVKASANLNWDNFPLKEYLENRINYKVRITNDANAAALGEAKFGAGKKYNDSVMITIGTGIGSGVVINKQLFEGNKGQGTELGHMVMIPNGIPCGCGRRGCYETVASATALIKQTKKAMAKNPESLLWMLCGNNIENISGKMPFDAEQQGDEVAHEVIEQYLAYVSEGLLNICNIFRPEVIILSGGVAKQGKNITDRINAYLKKENYGYYHSPAVNVVVAELGYDTGIIGAASLFIE